MNRAGFAIEIVPCGAPTHLEDLTRIKGMGLPLPHLYSAWPRYNTQSSWIWCRILEPNGQLATGIVVEVARSRIPGARVGRVDRLGRALHEQAAPHLGECMQLLARRIPRLVLLHVRVFDEDQARRTSIGRILEQAHGAPVRQLRDYSHTVTLPITDLEYTRRKLLTRRMQDRIAHFARSQDTRIEPIRDPAYIPRIERLLGDAFARTGGQAPYLDLQAVFNDATQSQESVLLGAFMPGRERPEDLVAFAWGRLNGDHVVYDAGGSEKSPELRQLSAGYGLIWQLAVWGHERKAAWLDLGGVVPAQSTDDASLLGIDAFKRRFSSNELRVADEFTFIPQTALGISAFHTRGLLKNALRLTHNKARTSAGKDAMSIEHEIVTTLAALLALESDWADLLGRSGNDLLPLTHMWIRKWWQRFGLGGGLRIHCFRRAGQLVAVLPMHSTCTVYRRLQLSQELSMANGHTPHTGLLHDAALDAPTIAQLARMVLECGDAELTTLERVPEHDALYRAFQVPGARIPGAIGIRRGFVTPLIRVQGSWDDFFAGRSQKFRKNMRNKVNRFGRAEGCRIERRFVKSADDAVFEAMEQVSRNSWKGKAGTDLGSVPEALGFLQDLAAELGPVEGVSVWIAYSGERPIAYEFHARYRGVTYPLRADFDEEFRELSPGSVVEYTALRDTFEDGDIHLYDSCANDYWYLGNWTEDMRVHYDIEIFRRSFKARLAYNLEYRVAPLTRTLRQMLKKRDDGAPKSSH